MRGVISVVVAATLLLSGCGELSAQDQPAIEETVTPAPVPSTTPTPVADGSAGVSHDRVDPAEVAAAHDQALANESYTLTTTVQWEDSNGTSYQGQSIVRADRDADTYVRSEDYAVARGSFNRTNFDVWYDGNQSLVRATFAQGPPEFQAFPNPTGNVDAETQYVRDLFFRLSVDRVSTYDDGSTAVQGSLASTPGLRAPQEVTQPSNGSMSAHIHPDGYVDRIAVGYDATVNGSAVRVREEMTVSDVGKTTVTEPAWVGNVTA